MKLAGCRVARELCRSRRATRRRRGQAAVEFLLVAAVLVLTVSVLAVLLFALRENGGRVLDLVAADAP